MSTFDFYLTAAMGFSALSLNAAIITGPVIPAPSSVRDDAYRNNSIQAFNERQGVTLASPLAVDGGTIAAGTTVNSHLIFLNSWGRTEISDSAKFKFDGVILGVMSDVGGNLEAASNLALGSPGTRYADDFDHRGLEQNDWYSFSGNMLKVHMSVNEPGDWIRVVSVVPEPGEYALLASFGLLGFAGYRRFAIH